MKKLKEGLVTVLGLAFIVVVLLLIMAFDFLLMPWVFMNLLSWIGIKLTFLQCLVGTLFIYLLVNWIKRIAKG